MKGEMDEKFQVHKKYWDQAPKVADILLIENVTEYELEKYVERFLGPEYESLVARVDPRLWGFGCARPRVYGLVWHKACGQWNASFPFEEILRALKAEPVMKAQDFFYLETPPRKLTPGDEPQQ